MTKHMADEWPVPVLQYRYFYVQRMPPIKNRVHFQFQLVKFNSYKQDIKKHLAARRLLQAVGIDLPPEDLPLFGVVKFHGAWRKFILVPEGGTLWSASCMTEARAFIGVLNDRPFKCANPEDEPVVLDTQERKA